MMKNILVVCSIFIIIPVSAMKRLRDIDGKNRSSKKICLEYTIKLPREIDQFIFDIAIDMERTLRGCIATIKACALTDKKQYELFNNQKYSDELIEKLSQKFHCAHEIVAKNLHTPQARKRLLLQKELLYLCSKNNFAINATQQFNQLIEQGALVDFTYNHNIQAQTLLMIHHGKLTNITHEIKCSSAFYWLTKKADFNQRTPQNKTLLMKVVKYPIYYHSAKTIIKHENVNINEQNHRGQTALLYCIENRKKHPMTGLFVATIEALLKNKANPLLADKYGNTPLAALYDIPEPSEMKDILIQRIKESIEKHQ